MRASRIARRVLNAIAVAILLLAGCGGLIQQQARETAAADHQCPLGQVDIVSDATIGMEYAYWLDVCGRRRLYRYQDSGSTYGGGRFLDATSSVR
jgi:hypothetical protein